PAAACAAQYRFAAGGHLDHDLFGPDSYRIRAVLSRPRCTAADGHAGLDGRTWPRLSGLEPVDCAAAVADDHAGVPAGATDRRLVARHARRAPQINRRPRAATPRIS